MTAQNISFRAAYAQSILHDHLVAKLNDSTPKNEHYDFLPEAPGIPGKVKDDDPYSGKVCIIGAGAAGLYTAMMLKFLGVTDVVILEATERVGGRCYTQTLSDDKIHHDYYDVGAMRIPEVPWMQHVLKFIDLLKLTDSKKPYVYKNDNAPCSYWYKSGPVSDDKFDAFMAPFVSQFTAGFDAAFTEWSKTGKDNHSTRSFLMAGSRDEGAPDPHWSYDETATAELYDTSTGLFDQSFTETVIDYADFQAAASGKWWRIDGGMQKLTDAMQNCLSSTDWPDHNSGAINVTTKSPVIAMSNDDTTNKISVTVAGQVPVQYDMVFNTTAMAPLQRMDLQGLRLPDDILTGIRSLSYDRATKVAIKFSKPWWNPGSDEVFGGISQSDLPIRNVVYPSWNDGSENSAVLMVSYSWAQDATRMASLVREYKDDKPSKDDPLVTLCLRDLVKLWSNKPTPPTFKQLSDLYVTHHAWAWEHDPSTGGAFALFGPGQFKNVYPKFQGPFCAGKFAMCGEALSAHHAWISGAFDSAYIRMNAFLKARGREKDLEKLKGSIFGDGQGKHPEEMSEHLLAWTVRLSDSGVPSFQNSELKAGNTLAE